MNILILTTGSGQNFGRSISHRLRRQLRSVSGDHAVYRYRVTAIDNAFQNHPEFSPTNTIIHCRAAHPTAQWMKRLEALEASGYRVINSTASLKLTSDKLKFWEMVNTTGLAVYDNDENGISTQLLPRDLNQSNLNGMSASWRVISPDGCVIKPRYSQGQGTFVHKLDWGDFTDLTYMRELVASMPNCPIVMQEVINYAAIFRVVVIGGHAYPSAITYDVPTEDDWKVSVCLNKRQLHYTPDEAVDLETYSELTTRLAHFAVHLQAAVAGEINFVDIFQTVDDDLVVSEINTACNLGIHSRLTGMDFAGLIANYLFRVVTA